MFTLSSFIVCGPPVHFGEHILFLLMGLHSGYLPTVFYIYLGCGWTPATTNLTVLSIEWFQYNTHLSNLQSYVYCEISSHIYVQTILMTEWGLPSILFNKTHNGPQHIKRPQKFYKRRGKPYKYVSCTMGQCLKHS